MKMKTKRKLCLLILFLYLLVLLQITVWRSGQFQWLSGGSVNLSLFREYALLLKNRQYLLSIYLFVGNLIWFVPLGFLLPKLITCRWYHIFWCGLLLSLLIETLQFLLGTGVSDLDDLILNTVGSMLGYALHHLRLPKKKKR